MDNDFQDNFSTTGKRLSFGHSVRSGSGSGSTMQEKSTDGTDSGSPLHVAASRRAAAGGFKPLKTLAVLTSGGDSQGMNAALRAIVRVTLYHRMKVYAVKEGYKGLVEGGNNFEECKWSTVDNIIHLGGTVIGTARCKEFMEREGRLRAAENLVKAGINNLVVIGGDGSLTGANLFKEEWKGLLKELVQTGRVCEEEADCCGYLNVVGLVGSIDNDMCGTDMTIGTDTALHRIIEAIDCLTSTAASHQRSFVLEVMGRHCGYLALMAGIAAGVDWALIPEKPSEPGWEEAMCKRMEYHRELGRRMNIIVVAEGAVDTNNKKITPQYVKEVIESKLQHDTRITILGHIQRGGKPSAYDRCIGCRLGAAAALVLLQARGEIDPQLVAVQGNIIVEAPLMNCVKRTRAIDKAMEECNFKKALELRSESFTRNVALRRRLETSGAVAPQSKHFRFAVMNIGAPAAGMNSAVRAFVRLMLYKGHVVLGVREGILGLLRDGDSIREMTWEDVTGWSSKGGSILGTNRYILTKEALPEVAAKFGEHHFDGLLIIGGFEAYDNLIMLQNAREHYTAFRIPLLGIAATISNNVPGTDYSLGCDTALNMIVNACDILRQSAYASRKRVFVVETMGGYCGYLATMASLAGGADATYIFEEKFSLSDIQKNVAGLVGKFQGGLERGLVIWNERCSVNFTTDFMVQLLAEEGKGMFITRSNKLGHLQQGEAPSPYDRILAVKYAAHAVDLLTQLATKSLNGAGKVRTEAHDTVCMLGLQGVHIKPTPIQELVGETDMEHRIPRQQWWRSLSPLLKMLSQHTEHAKIGRQYLDEYVQACPRLKRSDTFSEH